MNNTAPISPGENGWKSRNGCIAEVFGVERVHGAHIGRVRAARPCAAAEGARDDARAGTGVRASAVVCTLPCSFALRDGMIFALAEP